MGRQAAVGGGEFLERKTRNLGDHVVDAGLKTGRCGAARDVVAEFVEREADRQFGSDFGNRKARGLRRQRAGARHARVHLDDDHAAIDRVDGKLHVRAAGVHADFAQHGQAGIAQDLVFLVGERLCWSHGDGVAGVHAHGVQVFNRADDDAVVRLVTHHFHLILFPAQQRLFNQQFLGGRGFQAALANGLKLFGVVGDAAAGAAQGEAGADDGGETEGLLNGPSLVHAVGNARAGGTQADLGHRLFELETVFGFVDGLGRSADQLDLISLQHAVVPQIKRAVQRSLAAHSGQNRIGLFLGDDFFHRLPGDGLDVGHVRRVRVGHDGGGVAVDQNDFVALFAQRLARLHARIVKLASLADDDGTSADDQNAFNVAAFWHFLCCSLLFLRFAHQARPL